MKKTIICICFIFTMVLCKAQTGYFFAYGVNKADKIIGISSVENVSDYTNCEGNFNTKLKPSECLMNAYINSLKIEVGSNHSKYEFRLVTKHNSIGGYGNDEYFSSEKEAENKRKEVMASFSGEDYKILKLSL